MLRERVASDPALLAYVNAIASMPEWVERRRLDLWESEVTAREAKGASALHALARGVFELGAFNMYAAIEEAETAKLFEELRAAFAAAGVDAPAADAFDFENW